MDETYADRILNVVVTGAMVRIDLGSLALHQDKDDKPKLEFRRRLVMPVDGFLQSFALMAQVVQQLEKQGVIKRAPDAPGAGAQPGPNVRL
ncbi:MAG: hypothetical protein ACT4P9_08845 [Betaproteobacteria bacterium]